MALLQEATFGFANAQAPKENVLANEFPRNVFIRGNPTDMQWMVETDALEVQLNVQFDAVVFPKDGDSQAARARLESLLDLEIEEIHRTCRLSREQKKKLEMLGRGDIKRFFDRHESLNAKAQFLENDRRNFEELFQEARLLQTALRVGLFHDESLLKRSLSNTLSSAQFEHYEATVQKRQELFHRATINRIMNILESTAPLSESKRQAFRELLAKETRPARIPSQYDHHFLLLQIGRIPDQKLRPLFDEEQQRALSTLVEQAKTMEPTLRQTGYFPHDRDEAPQPNGPLTAPRR